MRLKKTCRPGTPPLGVYVTTMRTRSLTGRRRSADLTRGVGRRVTDRVLGVRGVK
jgi:hypothetical protein